MHTSLDTLRRDNPGPLLYGISDRLGCPGLDPRRYLELLFRTRAHILQWREKDLSPREAREFVRLGVALSRQTGKLFLVNTWVDLAREEGADGIHLTSRQSAVDALRVREATGRTRFLLGQSVHGLEEARRAAAAGVDYLLAGPVFPPLSKGSAMPPLGTELLSRIVEATALPVFALGGIEKRVMAEVLAAGAAGGAGISWLRREVVGLAG